MTSLANLLQPFWMLPILGLFQLRARDVMGYTLVVCAVLLPVVLLGTVLGRVLIKRMSQLVFERITLIASVVGAASLLLLR